MKKFMFLLLSHDSHTEMTPEEGQKVWGEWMAWYARLKEEGSLVDMGGPFTAEGCRVSADGVQSGIGRFADDGLWIGGWLMVQTADLESATEIAKGAPALKGSAIEVRELVNMSG